MNTDKDWRRYGEVDPYFGVITDSRFHSQVLTDDAREDFFRSGDEYVRYVMKTLREINPRFSPSRALDFGCGVGRVALPLAREATAVLGVDVSPGMLSEAGKNAAGRAVPNVSFAHEVSGSFDLVHSCIVLQHIAPRRGFRILGDLLSRLEPGGMVVLQVPYDWQAPVWRKLATRAMRVDPVAKRVLNIVRGRPLSYPAMATFCYDLGSVITMFRDAGIEDVRITMDTPSTVLYHSSVTLYGQRAPALSNQTTTG